LALVSLSSLPIYSGKIIPAMSCAKNKPNGGSAISQLFQYVKVILIAEAGAWERGVRRTVRKLNRAQMRMRAIKLQVLKIAPLKK
jgi:hypothetical protein